MRILLTAVVILALAAPAAAQQDTTEYDCRATKALSDVLEFVTAELSGKQEMWEDDSIFTIPEGTVGMIEERRFLLGEPKGTRFSNPYLTRFRFPANQNGRYGLWTWARCFGIERPRDDGRWTPTVELRA